MKDVLSYIKPYKKLAILAPVMMLLEVAAELSMPKIMTYLIDKGVGAGNTALIVKIGIMMLIISVIGIIGGVGCLICAAITSQKTGKDLRKVAFEKIQSFSFHNIDTFSTPSLITRLTNDITQIQLVIMMCRQYHHGIQYQCENCRNVYFCCFITGYGGFPDFKSSYAEI